MNRARSVVAIICVVVSMTALSSCGGPPDTSGIWEGDLQVPDVGKATLTLDLQQNSEGTLSGTIHAIEEDAASDEAVSTPIAKGSVNDDGTFQVVSSDEVGMNVSGKTSGEDMDAEFSLGGRTIPYQAKRITEEEARRRQDERAREAEEVANKQREAREDQDALKKRSDTLDAEVSKGVEDVERRFKVLYDAADTNPKAQLAAALGPKNPNEDFACSSGGVSCEVEDFAQLLESDIGDFNDENDLSPNNCDITTDRSYYEDFDLAKTDSGSDYTGRYQGIAEASDGLGADATGLIEKSREAEKAAKDYEEASGYEAGEYYLPEDVEGLASDATEVEADAENALATAEERYSGYESRAEEMREAALALHDREGC